MKQLLQTDYIDIGMIHYVDAIKDLETVIANGILDYAKVLKANGEIKAIGISSHNPQVALKAVETGDIDVLMFSVNPCYDLMPANEDVEELWNDANYDKDELQMDKDRERLYETCQKIRCWDYGHEGICRWRSIRCFLITNKGRINDTTMSALCFDKTWCCFHHGRQPQH